VPLLRQHGFRGSFPDFYREQNQFVSLLNFQYFSAGGSLCVNLSYADPSRANVYFRKESKPSAMRVSHMREQARLGSSDLGGDRWFSFGRTNYGEFRGNPVAPELLAAEIAGLINQVALPWWEAKRGIAS
jgi:hypothetical protein